GTAVVLWIVPFSRYWTGGLALLVSLLEVALWIEQAARFDFGTSGLQFETKAEWFKDLHVSYHIGFYGFSLWLAGLAVIVMAACIAYGFWVGRDRARAYFGSMLFLTVATVAVLRLSRLASGRLPGGAVGGDRGALGGDREGRDVRLPAHRDHEVPRADGVLPDDAAGVRPRVADLRVAARVSRARRARRDRVL